MEPHCQRTSSESPVIKAGSSPWEVQTLPESITCRLQPSTPLSFAARVSVPLRPFASLPLSPPTSICNVSGSLWWSLCSLSTCSTGAVESGLRSGEVCLCPTVFFGSSYCLFVIPAWLHWASWLERSKQQLMDQALCSAAFSHLILKMAPQDRRCYSSYTDEETEVPRGWGAGPAHGVLRDRPYLVTVF